MKTSPTVSTLGFPKEITVTLYSAKNHQNFPGLQAISFPRAAPAVSVLETPHAIVTDEAQTSFRGQSSLVLSMSNVLSRRVFFFSVLSKHISDTVKVIEYFFCRGNAG